MKKFALVALMATIAVPTIAPAPAAAQRYHHYRTYHGHGARHYRCRRSSGTTGLLAGAVGGGVLGNVLGGGALGTVIGAGGGALLGRHLDKRHDAAQNRRNGC